MITKDNLTKYILERSDDFKNYLSSSDSDWEDEGDYTVLAEYSRYVLDLFNEKKEDRLKSSFDLVEDVFINGDQYVQEAITIGFLETLQNNISWSENVKGETFLPFLSESLKIVWNNLNDFWKNRK
jgi:hypothetical protein